MICVTWTPWLLRIVTENGAFLAPVQRLDRRIGIEDPALAEQRLRAPIEMPLQPREAAWAAGQPSRALPRCVAPPANLPRHRIRVEVSWVAACALVAAPAATRRGHDAGNSGHQPGGTESPLRVIGCRLNPTLAASAFASSGHDVILACVGQSEETLPSPCPRSTRPWRAPARREAWRRPGGSHPRRRRRTPARHRCSCARPRRETRGP